MAGHAAMSSSNVTDRQPIYTRVFKSLQSLCEGESDPIALMATISCELFHAFEDFHWVGFYRNVGNQVLKIGPYQGGHGCLTIPFDRGVCGKCARERKTQIVPDVLAIPHHIACSSSTRSEIVVPVTGPDGTLLAVLDIDSDLPDAFAESDEQNLLKIVKLFQTGTTL